MRWYEHGGDPTRTAWIITLSYVLTVVLNLWALKIADNRHERIFWFIVSIMLTALASNKQLDLQTIAIASARDFARASHWYEYRRVVQMAFAIGLAFVAIDLVRASAHFIRRTRLDFTVFMAASGMSLLVLFVVIRGASINHVGLSISGELCGLRLVEWLEISGVALSASGILGFIYRRLSNRC